MTTTPHVSDPGQHDSTQGTDVGHSSTRPRYPLSRAAQMAGVSLSTVKRRLAAGEFPNAVRDDSGAWLVPVEDLLAAGFHLNRSTTQGSDDQTQATDPGMNDRVTDLERQLTDARATIRVEQARREAAEQVAAAHEQRAATAERALLMLEARREPVAPPAPVIPEQPAAADVTPPPPAVQDEPTAEPPRPRSRLSRWWRGE